jgi:hypothetical protein
MKLAAKKTIAAIAIGAFILAGVAVPYIVQADRAQDRCPAFGQRNVDPDKAAARLSETYGIDQATFLKYYNDGVPLRNLNRAAFLAQASGKSLDDVLALKTTDNSWRDVAKALTITQQQFKDTRNNLMSNRLSAKLGLDQQATLTLFDQGYRPRDVAMAGLLAQDTGKSMDDILTLKKINNTWSDVADTLGVDRDTMKQDAQKIRQAFPRRGHMGHGA